MGIGDCGVGGEHVRLETENRNEFRSFYYTPAPQGVVIGALQREVEHLL